VFKILFLLTFYKGVCVFHIDEENMMSKSERLYNLDLAPTPKDKKNWGWFEIFNVWANDVQSLFGYTLAASLFL
jgi:cytosine/uracil/thiamine/allantoin permease